MAIPGTVCYAYIPIGSLSNKGSSPPLIKVTCFQKDFFLTMPKVVGERILVHKITRK